MLADRKKAKLVVRIRGPQRGGRLTARTSDCCEFRAGAQKPVEARRCDERGSDKSSCEYDAFRIRFPAWQRAREKGRRRTCESH